MASTSSSFNVHPISGDGHHQSVANPAAVENSLWEGLPFTSCEAFPIDREPIEEPSIQEPEVTSKYDEDEGSRKMLDKLQLLWNGVVGERVARLTFERWTTSTPPDKQFLEEVIDLFAESRKRPMKTVKDSWDWLTYLETTNIGTKKYFAWVNGQHKLEKREKRKVVEEVTLEMTLNSLHTANWRDGNDAAMHVNTYLWENDPNLQPDIYLGLWGNFHLALRLNRECVIPQETDYQTAESSGVVIINRHMVQGIRYERFKDEKKVDKNKFVDLLFTPIGNIFRMEKSGDEMNGSNFRKGDWQDTGISLILRIVKNKGTAGDFYLVKDLQSARGKVGEDDASSWKKLGIDAFTLARVKDSLKLLKRLPPKDILNPGLAKKPELILEKLSVSKLEFVETGKTGAWSEGHLPMGLYPKPESD